MENNVTDRVLLRTVYDVYYSEFCKFKKDISSRESKVFVPIDCHCIAKKLKIDPDIVFGRLYYHLDKKYGYKQDNGAMVHLFAMKVGDDRRAVHFPLLSAVLAELEQSYYRFTIPLLMSVMALLVSAVSIAISIQK